MKKAFSITLICIFLLILYTQKLQSNFDILIHDDVFVLFDDFKGFFNDFIYAYHGRFLTNTLAHIIAVSIPLKFNIHPIEWMQSGAVFVKSIFIFCICFLIPSTCVILQNKTEKVSLKNYILIPIFTLLLYFFYQNAFISNYASFLYMSFYGFTLPFIPFFIFWQIMLKTYLSDEFNFSKNKLYLTALLAFVVGYSSEFFSFSTFASLTFLTVFWGIKKSKKLKNQLIIYVANILGLALYVSLPGFGRTCEEKIFISFSSIQSFINWFFETVQNLEMLVIKEYLPFILITAILFCILIFSKKENKNKKITASLIYLLGILSFYFTMSLVKRHFPNAEEADYQFLIHFDIIQQMKIALLFLISVQLSFLAEKKAVYNTITAVLLIYSITLTWNNIKDTTLLLVKKQKTEYTQKWANHTVDEYVRRYYAEKKILEAVENNEQIILTNLDIDPNCFVDNFDVYMAKIYGISVPRNNVKIESTANDNIEPLLKEQVNFNDLMKYKR